MRTKFTFLEANGRLMGQISWVKQIPKDTLCWWPEAPLVVFITAETLKGLDTYNSSTPTSPSPGRIYKKNLTWHDRKKPDDWWVYFVRDDPDEPGWQMHVPYRAIIIGHEEDLEAE